MPLLSIDEIDIAVVAPPSPDATVLSSAELAECTCPEACERDHDRD